MWDGLAGVVQQITSGGAVKVGAIHRKNLAISGFNLVASLTHRGFSVAVAPKNLDFSSGYCTSCEGTQRRELPRFACDYIDFKFHYLFVSFVCSGTNSTADDSVPSTAHSFHLLLSGSSLLGWRTSAANNACSWENLAYHRKSVFETVWNPRNTQLNRTFRPAWNLPKG